MTVQSSTSRADYSGNGVVTAFTVPFYFLDPTHLIVYKTDTTTGTPVVTTLVLNSDYTVAGTGVQAGGTITLTVAPTSLMKISVLRNVPETQLLHYTPNTPFPSAASEAALDQMTMALQQVYEQMGRTVVLPPNVPASQYSSTMPTPVANQLIGWNSNANGLTTYAPLAAQAITNLATVNYNNGGTGAVNRTLQSKLVADTVYSVADFGAVGNGITDDTLAINLAVTAMAYAGGGVVTIPSTFVCLVASGNISLPGGVFLVGPWLNPGWGNNGANIRDFSQVRGAILLSSSYSIIPTGNSSGVKGLYILRQGMTYATNLTQAQTLVGSFAGTAINATAGTTFIGQGSISGTVLTITSVTSGALAASKTVFMSGAGQCNLVSFGTGTGGVGTYNIANSYTVAATTATQQTPTNINDFYVGHCCFLGFNQAIYTNFVARYFFENIKGDCTNGIHTTNAYDIGRTQNCHFWPFLTANLGAATSTFSPFYRSGTGIDIDYGNDASEVVDSFTFGYAIGFHIGAANGTTYLGCYVDASAPDVSAGGTTTTNCVAMVGVLCDGIAADVLWFGGGISSHGYGFKIMTAGQAGVASQQISIENTVFTGNFVDHVYQAGSRLTMHQCSLQDLYAAGYIRYGVEVASTAVQTNILDCTFFNIGSPWLAGINDFTQLRNKFMGTSGIPEMATETLTGNSASIQTSHYSYSTQSGVPYGNVQRYLYANGTPAAPAIPSAATSVCTFSQTGLVLTNAGSNTYSTSAGIRYATRTTVSSSNADGCIIFSTTPTGSTSGTDKAYIDPNGNFCPVTSNSNSIGGPDYTAVTKYWAAIYATTGTIQTSDRRYKTDIAPSVLGLDFINALNPVSYKWKSGGTKVIRQVYLDAAGNEIPEGEPIPHDATHGRLITEDTPGVRTHWGLLAQEVKEVVDAAGVDFAGWVLTNKDDPDSMQAVRYDQLIAPLIKAVQELTARVKQLENPHAN